MINRLICLCASVFYSLVTLAQPAFQKKASPALWKEISISRINDSVDISVRVKDFSELKNVPKRVLDTYFSASIFFLRMKKTDVATLLENPVLLFADIKNFPKEELTTGSLDLTLNRINISHTTYPEINGDSIFTSIKEQQFDTADIDYINRIIKTGQGAPGFTTHASVMATILAGGGNSSPYAKGAAPAAFISSSTFGSLFPHSDSIYRKYSISIQNHSYGTVIENFYGNEATAYDASVLINPTLLHVFSSGNSGTSNAASGVYTASPGFSNLTGNFKSAKNIIVTGATDSFGVVASLSSRGPAYDGRVKPELVAFGEDGSSGAAAMTSGAAALVQQAYKKLKGKLPPASLVKAVLVNGADDTGNPHVDYISGYGNLNAWNAVRCIKENRFIEDSIFNAQTKTFNFSVLANAREIKITVSWSDALPSASASKALVNDLDMTLNLPAASASWQPWVLDPRPANILLPAQRKTDTLNNTEQITLDNPVAGNYIIEIKGTNVSSAKQLFSVAWQTDTLNYFAWTFPSKNEPVKAAATNVIRWQSNITGTGVLDYSTDGTTWTNISSAVNLTDKYFKWNAPDSFSKAFLRMTPASGSNVLSDTFILSKATSLSTAFNCTDSFMLYWDRLKVNQYQIYELGAKYLQPFLVTTDSFIILRKSQHPTLYYAVAPVVSGKPGLRSFTLKYDAQGVECYFRNFYMQLQTQQKVDFTATLGSVYNVASLTFQKLKGNGYADLQTITAPGTLYFSFSDSNLLRGVNYYRLQIKLASGASLYSEIVPIYHYPDLPVIVFPNPVAQNRPINIISQEPGKYYISVIDGAGRVVMNKHLRNLNNPIPGILLPKGIYFIQITKDEGKVGVEKLVVY